MFGNFAGARHTTSLTFMSQIGLFKEIPQMLGLKKSVVAVGKTRTITKQDMKLNDWLPRIEVDPETYEVRANGELLTCEPATILPMAQRYFLF